MINNYTQIAFSERQNIDTSNTCISNWFTYGINPEHVNEEYLKNNYVELVKLYGGNLIYILLYFAFTDLKNKYTEQLRFSNEFCRRIFSKLSNVDKLQFKNPYLLILGYWIGNPDKSINIEKFKQAVIIADEVEEYKLTGADILRYHNFWNNI